MNNNVKVKQIVIRFDIHSYEMIRRCAECEHRGLGDFVRHAALDYVERHCGTKKCTERELSSSE